METKTSGKGTVVVYLPNGHTKQVIGDVVLTDKRVFCIATDSDTDGSYDYPAEWCSICWHNP